MSATKLTTLIMAGVLSLVILLGLLGSFFVVDEGERAVMVRNGQVIDVAQPGLHFKMPFITSANTISIRNELASYEMLQSYTTDQQIATVEAIYITYRIPADRVEDVYREFKYAEAVVDRYVGRRVNSELEKVFGQYTAERSVKERVKLSADIAKALKDVPEGAPIEILTVEVASVEYPPEYSSRINERMDAEIIVAKKKQEVLQAEQDRMKAQQVSDAEAYQIRAKAQADADATRLRGEAEADAIKAKGEALRDNPALVSLIQAERWNGILPTTMLPGGTVPFIDVEPSALK